MVEATQSLIQRLEMLSLFTRPFAAAPASIRTGYKKATTARAHYFLESIRFTSGQWLPREIAEYVGHNPELTVSRFNQRLMLVVAATYGNLLLMIKQVERTMTLINK